MPELTSKTALQALFDWLQDNIDFGSEIILNNDEENTDSAKLLPQVEKALQDVRALHHLQLLQQASTD